MKIEKIVLETMSISNLYSFYVELLGFNCIYKTSDSFSFSAGSSRVTFRQANIKSAFPYHVAFTVPEGALVGAIRMLTKKAVTIIEKEEQQVFSFDDWNAKALYFLDPDENIIEFIVRHNLKINTIQSAFSVNDILSVSEIGMVVDEPGVFAMELKESLGINIWKEQGLGFKALGSEEGLLIIVKKNRQWYPTEIPAKPRPLLIQSPDFQTLFRWEDYLFVPC